MPQAVLDVASRDVVKGWREGRARQREEKGRRKRRGGRRLVRPTEGKMDISSVGLTPSPLKLDGMGIRVNKFWVHDIRIVGNFSTTCT
jgi:hypothetical protein